MRYTNKFLTYDGNIFICLRNANRHLKVRNHSTHWKTNPFVDHALELEKNSLYECKMSEGVKTDPHN